MKLNPIALTAIIGMFFAVSAGQAAESTAAKTTANVPAAKATAATTVKGKKITENDIKTFCQVHAKGKRVEVCMKKGKNRIGKDMTPREARKFANAEKHMAKMKAKDVKKN